MSREDGIPADLNRIDLNAMMRDVQRHGGGVAILIGEPGQEVLGVIVAGQPLLGKLKRLMDRFSEPIITDLGTVEERLAPDRPDRN